MKADRNEVVKRLKLAKGQMEGIIKMVDDDRYCIDISQQLLATIALLKNANKIILTAHLKQCVAEVVDDEGKKKIEEIVEILGKIDT
ncbi:MAG: metal-sensing transcriptional repressor [Candidatus Izemoplasmatales bacterium]|jgi:DNA-binding FrmR family transcriptional regulator|nr:metal-sensing transcriptional repressor [Candidatus Izemoplasmatales bacterium]MDD5293627.1 metal-sensing transcriptional repressor [Candidatus Izemoplasmatales bacterium]